MANSNSFYHDMWRSMGRTYGKYLTLKKRRLLMNNGTYRVLTESVEKKSGDPGVDGKYCKDYMKHKKEKRFLIHMNVAICGSEIGLETRTK